MNQNNLIFFIFLIFFGLLSNKYFPKFLNKYSSKLLIDDEIKKPQAFHEKPISVAGGVVMFSSFLIICCYLFLKTKVIYFEYLSFGLLFFSLGFSDDLKLNLKPKLRLILMISFLIILVISNQFYIQNVGIQFLNRLLQIDIFSLFFVCLCFLFIINGSNLIDGYNGLLGIHILIILTNLLLINYFTNNTELAFLIFSVIIILLVFLKYNFPKANIFLGDSGSYFLGAFTALSVIKTSIANPSISPFYFCILLFYLFFEVFFSFIRKIVSEKKSPLFPDSKHLHMLLYKILFKKNKNKYKSNYLVSVIINLIYLILIIPSIFMMNSGLFCKYYSITFFVIYIFLYKLANKKLNQIK